jgi:integrase/recombinase XerD
MSFAARFDFKVGRFGVFGADGAGVDNVNRFLRAVAVRGLSSQTIRAYAFDLVHALRWLESHGRSLRQVREPDLVEYIADQREEGAQPRSINRRLTVLRLIYTFLTGRQLQHKRGVNRPARYFRGPGHDHNLGVFALRPLPRMLLRVKVPRTLVVPLSRNQVRRFLRTVRRYRDLAIVHLMLLCGLRSHEVLLLTLDDIDFGDRRIKIHGKGAKERMMPLPGMLAKTLHRYFELERPDDSSHRVAFVVLQGPRRGAPMTMAGLRRLFRYRRLDPQLALANAHRFRHTFGIEMARAGVRLPVLQQMLGHAHPETTTQYVNLVIADVAREYSHAVARLQRGLSHAARIGQ